MSLAGLRTRVVAPLSARTRRARSGRQPRHAFDPVSPEDLESHSFGTLAPVGNGPFRFVERVPGDRWVFEANPGFPEDLGGRPYVDRLVYRQIPDEFALAAALQTGEVDLVIDSGHCGIEPTTVIDLTGDVPVLVREGMGRDHGLD